MSDLTETRILVSPSIPNGTKLLLLLVFVLIAPWSCALIYFIRENLGKKMVVSEANRRLPDAGLGTGERKGERGLAVSSHLLPVAVPVPRMLPAPHNPCGAM